MLQREAARFIVVGVYIVELADAASTSPYSTHCAHYLLGNTRGEVVLCLPLHLDISVVITMYTHNHLWQY